MKISKQLNNNIIIASDSQGREVVLMGKGIGFGCRIGEEPDMSLVEKQFFGLSSGQHIPQLAELLNRIPLEHLSVGIQIVEHVEKKIQKPLNETLVLMISDHVNFAIERKKKGKGCRGICRGGLLLYMGKSVKMRLPHEAKTGRKICIHMLQ